MLLLLTAGVLFYSFTWVHWSYTSVTWRSTPRDGAEGLRFLFLWNGTRGDRVRSGTDGFTSSMGDKQATRTCGAWWDFKWHLKAFGRSFPHLFTSNWEAKELSLSLFAICGFLPEGHAGICTLLFIYLFGSFLSRVEVLDNLLKIRLFYLFLVQNVCSEETEKSLIVNGDVPLSLNRETPFSLRPKGITLKIIIIIN